MRFRALALAFALALPGGPARGGDVQWVDPLGGAYEDPGNWSGPMMPPGAEDVGVFDLDAIYTVELNAPPANALLRIAQGDVTFDLNGSEFPFSFEVGDQPGRLGVVDGSLVRTLTLDSQESDFPAFLRIGADARLESAFLGVGFLFDGGIEIADGGLAAADSVVLGDLQQSFGALLVRGAGSQLDVSGRLVVAYDGLAMLSVLDRGLLTTSEARIAEISETASCCGAVTVADAGSLWANAGDLVVGGATLGSLSIAGGGRVTTRNAFLGIQGLFAEEGLAGTGNIDVSDAGSLLRVSEALVLGGDLGDEAPSVEPGGPGGFGSLHVASGARATVGEQLLLWNEAQVELAGGALDVGSLASSAAPGEVRVHSGGSLGGTGTVIGAASIEGSLDPGAAGGGSGLSALLLELGDVSDAERLLRVEGDLAFAPGAELRIDLAGDAASPPGIGYDAVEATGVVDLGGVLAVEVAPEVLAGLSAIDTFTILFGSSCVNGAFENAPSGRAFPIGGDLGWLRAFYGPDSPYDPGSVVLTDFSTVPEPAQELLVGVGALALGLRGRVRRSARCGGR